MPGALNLFFMLALGISLQAAATPDDHFARALEERMPGLLAKYRVPGAVVSCITNGDVAWTKAFGLANRQTGAPMQPDMVVNHGCMGAPVFGVARPNAFVHATSPLVMQDTTAPGTRYFARRPGIRSSSARAK